MLIDIPPKSSPRIFASTKNKNELELVIYDSIGESFWGGGIRADSIQQKIAEAGDVNKIKLRVNSPGGDVFEAAAIYSLLRQHKAEVECFVDGLAASAAFTITMAADTIHISDAAMMMCHNASGGCTGYARDFEKFAQTLQSISLVMASIYSGRSGMTTEEVQRLMNDETWMSCAEAVEYGFADDVIRLPKEEGEWARAIAASFDLAAFPFRHADRAIAAFAPKRPAPAFELELLREQFAILAI